MKTAWIKLDNIIISKSVLISKVWGSKQEIKYQFSHLNFILIAHTLGACLEHVITLVIYQMSMTETTSSLQRLQIEINIITGQETIINS
jgi:hypothetical protein